MDIKIWPVLYIIIGLFDSNKIAITDDDEPRRIRFSEIHSASVRPKDSDTDIHCNYDRPRFFRMASFGLAIRSGRNYARMADKKRQRADGKITTARSIEKLQSPNGMSLITLCKTFRWLWPDSRRKATVGNLSGWFTCYINKVGGVQEYNYFKA